MQQRRMVRATWYLLVLVPLVIGAAITVHGVDEVFGSLESSPRVVVPGSGEVVLEARHYVLYAEERSTFQGTVYRTTSLSVRCAMRDETGGQIALEHAPVNEHYSAGEFAGSSMFEMTAPHAGTYRLMCEGQGGPATIAFGNNIVGSILWLVFGVIGGLLVTAVTIVIVYRVRQKSRAAYQASLYGLPPP
jgi:hypothetical protein